jgi:hypothetical protein
MSLATLFSIKVAVAFSSLLLMALVVRVAEMMGSADKKRPEDKHAVDSRWVLPSLR